MLNLIWGNCTWRNRQVPDTEEMFEWMFQKRRRRLTLCLSLHTFTNFMILQKKEKKRNSLAHKPPGYSTGIFLKRTLHYHLCTAPPRLQHPPRGEWLPCTSNHESLIPEIATVQGLQKPHKYQFPRASSLQLHSCTRHGLITALSCFLALISVEGNWRWAPPETDG